MFDSYKAGLVAVVVLIGSVFYSGECLAERTKVVVIWDIVAVDCDVSDDVLKALTESIYAGATELSPERFSVVSRQKLMEVLAANRKAVDTNAQKGVGATLGADMIFSGELRKQGVQFEVTLKLTEANSGRILGLERANAEGLDPLWDEVRSQARKMIIPLAAIGETTPAQPSEADIIREEPEVKKFMVRFKATPFNSKVFMDGKVICRKTPCSYKTAAGDHKFVVHSKYFKPQTHNKTIDGDAELSFKLEPEKYNYFGMHDADGLGWGFTVGVSPMDTEYKAISILNGSWFSGRHPVFDGGIGGEVFGYRQTQRGKSWSIFGFGPTLRAGRLIISSNVQLLSFRVENNDEYQDGWLPGVSVKAQLPLVNAREVGGWSAWVPVPTAGYDIWFTGLDYDQQQFWVGFSWLGGVGHISNSFRRHKGCLDCNDLDDIDIDFGWDND